MKGERKMANVYWSCVNMSGISCPVYDASNRKIGDIMPREFFTYIGFVYDTLNLPKKSVRIP